MGLLDFIERGPERTEWLSDTIGGAVEYLTPPNLRPVVEMAAQFNPIQGMADSMTQFGVATDPTRSMDERRAAAMGSAVEGLLAVVPAAMASQGYMKPAQATMEGLLGGSPAAQQIGDDLGRFWADEAGNIRLWHGSPYDFDKFDLANLGRGEGAQDLGRGFSLTDAQGEAILYTNPASRWGDLAAMEKYRQAGPGRYYAVDVNATPEQFLDWNALWRSQVQEGTPLFDKILEQERKLMSIYGDDPAMAEAIPQAKLSRMWEDNAGFEDAAAQSGFVGNMRRNYSGDTEYTVFDPANLSVAEKFDADGNPIGLLSDPITQRGDEILDLLKRDPMRVTDDMLDMGADTPRLNEYLFRNYDLPMDQASRMARAEEMGFDEVAYHGTDVGDIAELSPDMGKGARYGTGIFTAPDAAVASSYAPYRTGSVMPLSRRSTGTVINDAEGANWASLPSGDVYDPELGEFVTIIDPSEMWDASPSTNDMARNVRQVSTGGDMDQRLLDDLFDELSDDFAVGDVAPADRWQPSSVSFMDVRDHGPYRHGSFDAQPSPETSTTTVDFDPTNIRSRFARFDPRLSHLKNLSAGIGGVGLFGLLSPQEQQGGI